MDISQALDKTLKDCSLSAREVAEKAGIDEGVISKFRNSRKRVYTDTLDKILGALNDEAKIYLFGLLLGKEINLKMIVAGMDAATLSELLLIIADRISPEKKKSTNEEKVESDVLEPESNNKKAELNKKKNDKKVVVTGSK